jgi:sulfate adenylyltransferase
VTGAQSGSVAMPAPHGGRLTERLVAAGRFEHAVFCRRCEGMATSRTCQHPAATRVHLSGTAVRDLLARGQLPPPQFSRPEVARQLADGYRAQRG